LVLSFLCKNQTKKAQCKKSRPVKAGIRKRRYKSLHRCGVNLLQVLDSTDTVKRIIEHLGAHEAPGILLNLTFDDFKVIAESILEKGRHFLVHVRLLLKCG
jgi:hypothetical protein